MKTARRMVVITGLGAVTPLGRDVASTWDAMKKGRSAVAKISLFDASGFPTRIAGEVKAFDIAREVPEDACPRKLRKFLDRKTSFAAKAAHEAMVNAKIAPGSLDPTRFGVAMGTEAGRPLLEEIADRILDAKRKGVDLSDLQGALEWFQKAYELVQKSAMRAFSGEGAFKDNLKADPDVLAVLSAPEIEACFDLAHALAHVDTIIDRALQSD